MSRTLYEVNWRVRSIIKRHNLERKFSASLVGREISEPTIAYQNEKTDPAREEAIKKAIKDAQLRKMKEYGRRHTSNQN